jgi:hypothetical protein
MPLAKMAATLVTNSEKAPRDRCGTPDSRVSPITASGGTSEIAIATPGKVSETVAGDTVTRSDHVRVGRQFCCAAVSA